MLDQNISRYIWTHTRVQQMWILCVVALSMIPYFLSFDLPKQIVNGPIQGRGFEEEGATQTFFNIAVTLPGIGEVTLFEGVDLDRFNMLMALSGVFLALVIINGLFKFYINTYKGKLGERLLRRLRFALVDQILRFPPAVFRRVKPAEMAGMVKDEVEPMGGFAGEAFVTPALLGGQAITALVFIFLQSVPLGLMTAAIVGIQVVIIPRMRRRLLVLGRERQLTARELAGRVSEIVDGVGTIHAYDTSNFERADIAARLGRIFRIRFDIYQWKFLVKFINNFLASVAPFLFYSVGGWLALEGRLDIGQLVAVIAAYRDLPGPLKELIDWDQNRQDVQVKYQTVMQQFVVEGVIDPAVQALDPGPVPPLAGPLAVQNMGVTDDSGAALVEGVTLALRAGEAVALVGPIGSGADMVAEVLGRTVWHTAGKVLAGGDDLAALPEAVTGRAITYAGPDPFFIFGTLRDNLLYGLKHAPLRDAVYEGEARARRDWERREALRAGNPDHDPLGDWIDYAAAGASGPEDLMPRVLEVLEVTALTRDVLDMGLRSTFDPALRPDLADRLVEMRQDLRDELQRAALDDLIVPFEPASYNIEATVLENLVFGHIRRADLGPVGLGAHPWFRRVLVDQGLDGPLFAMGLEVARTVIELFGELPPDHPLLLQQALMTADDLPLYQAMVARIDGGGTAGAEDRAALIRLSFGYIEPRYRFGLMTDAVMAASVAFRAAFREGLPADLSEAIDPYDPDRHIASLGVLDNMLFGRISQKYRDGGERVQGVVARLVEERGMRDEILSVGLDFHVGTQGKRLSSAQRQKFALARALIRRSAFHVFNRPLSALDARSQEQLVKAALQHLRQDGDRDPGILWVVAAPGLARHFDRVAVFEKGRLAEEGTPEALLEKKGIFAEMLSA
ncbi:MAG: ABC transporter transmembrane domain-containing protein [Gemmobacter sp.]